MWTCLSCPLLTVYYFMYGLCWLGVGKRGHITHHAGDHYNYSKSNVLLVLTAISGLPLSGHNVEVTA